MLSWIPAALSTLNNLPRLAEKVWPLWGEARARVRRWKEERRIRADQQRLADARAISRAAFYDEKERQYPGSTEHIWTRIRERYHR